MVVVVIDGQWWFDGLFASVVRVVVVVVSTGCKLSIWLSSLAITQTSPIDQMIGFTCDECYQS